MKGRIWTIASVTIFGAALFATAATGALTLKTAKTEVALESGELEGIAASCKRGFRAVAGGFDDPTRTQSGPGTYTLPFGSERTGKRTWTSSLEADGDAGQALAFAYCSDDLPKLKAVETSASFDPESNESVSASCPRGGEAVSGGFRTSNPEDDAVWIWESYRSSKRGWIVSAWNNTGDTQSVTAVAYCGKQKLGLKTKSRSTSGDGNELVSATAKCKRNSKVVSGGFAGAWGDDHNNFTELAGSHRSGKRGWTATASSYNGSGIPWTAFAYCLKKNALD